MKENQKRKVCSFYVNDWHLTTMMLPYINKRIKEHATIITAMENGIQDKVSELLSNMNLAKQDSQNILEIGWTSNKLVKYTKMKKQIEEALEKTDTNLDILVSGKNEYLEMANQNIEKVLKENSKKLENRTITIINCYEVTQFHNISDVLQKHDLILNTSGLKPIKEVFEGYDTREDKLAN